MRDKDREFYIYSIGMFSISVCSSLSIEEITERLNKEVPTGIESRWKLAEEKVFKDGTPMPHQCHMRAENKHYLFHC